MFAAAVILLTISIISLGIWVHGMFCMFSEKKPEIQNIDRTVKEIRTTRGFLSFKKEVSIVKEKGFETEMRSEMTYDQIADGIKKRDPGVFLFLRIAAGFGIGLLSLIAAIGCFVVYGGSTDGYFMIGTSAFFTGLFLFIIIEQRMKKKKKPEISE